MEVSGQTKLRSDLLVTKQEDLGQTVYILKDPKTQRFFRLKNAEYLVASQLDGSFSIPDLASHLRSHFHLNVTEEALSKFIEKLSASRLLESNTADDKTCPSDARTRRWLDGFQDSNRSRLTKALYWKVAYFDPDLFFSRLLPNIRFLFTPTFVGFAMATILFALGITINNWGEISEELYTVISTKSILWALLVMFPIIVFHETAHGMTCKYFGGEVHEMGFLLLYFQPSCFCNVSDSYLFKKKSQRIAVLMAGVFIQSFIWAILTIFWRILTPENAIAQFIFVTIAVSGFISILQFNPLLKTDGYYILSELFGIPNLRAKSFDYLKTRLRSIFLGASKAIHGLTPRDRRIYWAYGIIAFIYSFHFVKFFVLKLEQYFVEQYQGTGFILFWGLALFVVSEPLVESIRGVFPTKVAERKHSLIRHKNLFAGSFLLLGGALLLGLGRWELKVANECILLPFDRADVRAEVAGTIDKIYFDEGQTVHAGEVVARLADYKYVGEKEKTLARINEVNAQLQLMKTGPTKEEIALAQSKVDSAEASVKKAQAQLPIARERMDFAAKNFERSKKMMDEKLLATVAYDEAARDLNIRKREFDEIQHEVEEKRREFIEAGRGLAKVMAGTRAEEIEAKQAEIEGLQSQVRTLEWESAFTSIRSPIDGVITTHFLKQKEKSYLEQGAVICQVADTRKMQIEIPVPEKEVGDVRVGYYVRLKANAYPSRSFDGRVTQIAQSVDQRDRNVRVVMVRSEVDNPELLLKPEMTGYAKIYCGKRTIGELVTRRMVRFIRTEFWSWF